jgi:rod shape-determining protein MreC
MTVRPEHLRRTYAVGIGLIVLHLALLFFDSGSARGPVGIALERITAPVNEVLVQWGDGVSHVWTDYLALVDVREDNRRLQQENNVLKGRIASLKTLSRENVRLAALLDIAESRKDLRLKIARVKRRSRSRHYRVVGIELDSTDGVEAGMAVIAQGGLVGQIRDVDDEHASVLLVTDPRSAVDIVLEKSRVRGIAVGSGHPTQYSAQLRYLNRSARIVSGESVLTTGDDGRFPAGLVVGQVSPTVGGKGGPFKDAQVQAAVDFNDLEVVYVVLGTTGLTRDGQAFLTGKK